MNRKQLVALWIGIALFVLAGLFPPWIFPSLHNNVARPAPYKIIFTPPELVRNDEVHYRAIVDTPRLAVEWIVILALTGGMVLIMADKKPKGLR